MLVPCLQFNTIPKTVKEGHVSTFPASQDRSPASFRSIPVRCHPSQELCGTSPDMRRIDAFPNRCHAEFNAGRWVGFSSFPARLSSIEGGGWVCVWFSYPPLYQTPKCENSNTSSAPSTFPIDIFVGRWHSDLVLCLHGDGGWGSVCPPPSAVKWVAQTLTRAKGWSCLSLNTETT